MPFAPLFTSTPPAAYSSVLCSSLLEAKATGWRSPDGCICSRTAPSPNELASAETVLAYNRWYLTIHLSDVSSSFTLTKVASCSYSQVQREDLLTTALIGVAMSEMCGRNLTRWFTTPSRRWTPATSFGASMVLTLWTLRGSGLIPSADRMTPRNGTSDTPNKHLLVQCDPSLGKMRQNLGN